MLLIVHVVEPVHVKFITFLFNLTLRRVLHHFTLSLVFNMAIITVDHVYLHFQKF